MQLGKTNAIKHSGGVITYFHNHLSPNLSQWKEGSHNSYLWIRVNKDAAPNLFVYVVYATPIGSKHESEIFVSNLAIDTVEVKTLEGIVLLRGILMHVL